jgi:hypothetical protein
MPSTCPILFRPAIRAALFACITLAVALPIKAQTAPAAEAAAPAPLPLTIESLSWVTGCWQGDVNGREFREEWLPLRGGMLVGISQTVMQDKTLDFEYLRLETRPDGVYYVAVPSGTSETAFRLTSIAPDAADTVFTFSNAGDQFPQRIVYRRNPKGWLYAHVEGKLNGEEKRIIYPMQRIDCQSGELLRK